MLLWCGFKAFQRESMSADRVAHGARKNKISLYLLQNMMVGGVGPKPSAGDLTRLLSKTSFSLVKNTVPQVGWLAGWVAGWLAGGLAGWLAGWRVGWLIRLLVSTHTHMYWYQ